MVHPALLRCDFICGPGIGIAIHVSLLFGMSKWTRSHQLQCGHFPISFRPRREENHLPVLDATLLLPHGMRDHV